MIDLIKKIFTGACWSVESRDSRVTKSSGSSLGSSEWIPLQLPVCRSSCSGGGRWSAPPPRPSAWFLGGSGTNGFRGVQLYTCRLPKSRGKNKINYFFSTVEPFFLIFIEILSKKYSKSRLENFFTFKICAFLYIFVFLYRSLLLKEINAV